MAGAFAGLNRLLGDLRESNHDFKATTEIFPPLDVEKVAKELRLATLAEERGKQDLPLSTAKDRDDVEIDVINRIEEAKATAYHNLEDHLQLFKGRLSGLDFQGQFSNIEKVNSASLSDFKAEVVKGRNILHGLRHKLQNADKELKAFQEKHKIFRAPRSTQGASMFFKISVIVFIFLFEWIANGFLLSKGSEMGVIGGIVEALFFSFLNIGFTLVLTLFGIVLISHRNLFLKLIGVAAICAYALMTTSLNLVLAHFREISGSLIDGAGMLAVDRFLNSPFGLTELQSWLLFGVGLLFSVITMIDGLYLRDPYVGYARVYRQRDQAEKDYYETQAELIDGLIELRDEHHEKVDAIVEQLNGRRREHNAILAHRAKVLALFQSYQDQLERSAIQLLARYRNANIQARSTEAPKYFSSPFKLDRLKPTMTAVGELSDKDIAKAIKVTQDDLSGQIKAIAVTCEQGIEEFRELDKLFPEVTNV
ncbi:hypothetical protein [Ensifer aridi]|uniref:hypothetical protein n=1 Tax=Ensifer aridi TaxID=1708715 RepID=UPI00358F335E